MAYIRHTCHTCLYRILLMFLTVFIPVKQANQLSNKVTVTLLSNLIKHVLFDL